MDQIVEAYYPHFHEFSNQSKEYLYKLLKYIGPNITTINEIESDHMYLFQEVDYSKVKVPNDQTRYIIEYALANGYEETLANLSKDGVPKKNIFMSLRFALSGGKSGLSIPHFIDLMGGQEFRRRLTKALKSL